MVSPHLMYQVGLITAAGVYAIRWKTGYNCKGMKESLSSYPATPLGVPDLRCVREELLDVSRKWFDIGLTLELNVGFLECVRDQYPDPSTALREMLLQWLKKVDPPPTWEGLACALESRTVGEPRLAEQLRTKYCKTDGAAGQLVYITKLSKQVA